jgi:hypothetical protein
VGEGGVAGGVPEAPGGVVGDGAALEGAAGAAPGAASGGEAVGLS